MRKLFSAVIILLLAASLAHAAEKAPSIKTSASPDKIFIGDRIHYQVEISSRKDIEVQFPKFAEDKMGDFEINDLERKDARTFLGVHVITNRYLITTYSTGKKTIPAMEVRYKEKGQKDWGALKTTPVEIDIESVLPKNTVIADIKGIKGPMSFPDIFLMVVVGFLAALFIYILVVSLRKFLKKRIPKKLPYETALDELEKTRAAFAKSRNIKEYYVAISDITRQYIESTYSLKAPEMTTEEFLQSLKDSAALTAPHKDLLREFLESCDLVKFAKYAPTDKEIDSVYSTARRFVEETKDIYSRKEEGAG